MPLYAFYCADCNKTEQEIRKVENRDEPMICECGEEMQREPSATAPPRIQNGTPKFYK